MWKRRSARKDPGPDPKTLVSVRHRVKSGIQHRCKPRMPGSHPIRGSDGISKDQRIRSTPRSIPTEFCSGRGIHHASTHPRRNDLPEMHEPGDHQHRPAEKPPALGTFPNEFELEVCVCGARQFAYLDGEPATAGSSGRESRSRDPSEGAQKSKAQGGEGRAQFPYPRPAEPRCGCSSRSDRARKTPGRQIPRKQRHQHHPSAEHLCSQAPGVRLSRPSGRSGVETGTQRHRRGIPDRVDRAPTPAKDPSLQPQTGANPGQTPYEHPNYREGFSPAFSGNLTRSAAMSEGTRACIGPSDPH